jgi:hypothetical protein
MSVGFDITFIGLLTCRYIVQTPCRRHPTAAADRPHVSRTSAAIIQSQIVCCCCRRHLSGHFPTAIGD